MVQVGQGLILLVSDKGVFYALQGLCAHENLPLVEGQGVLNCLWHHFQYDICTGKNLYPQCLYPLDTLPHLRKQLGPLRTYPARVVDGVM